MARMSESTVRELGMCALEYVVALHAPNRIRARVVQAHFPNAPRDMRWSVSSSVRTRDQGQSRATFAGYPAKLRADARDDAGTGVGEQYALKVGEVNRGHVAGLIAALSGKTGCSIGTKRAR